MSDTPLIIVLLKYFFKLLGYIFSIVALPITLYSLLVSAIINTDVKSKSTHLFICIPRILLVIPFWPAFLLLSYLYGYLISLALKDPARWVPFVIALGGLFAVAIGFWFTRFASFLKKSMPDFKTPDYFKSLGEAFLDLGAIFALVLSVATVIRLPFLLSMCCSSNPKKSIRKQLYLHMALILFDILAVPLFLIEMLTVLRAGSILHYIKKRNYDNIEDISFKFELRFRIYLELFIVLIEIFVILLGFLFVISPWRIPSLHKEVRHDNGSYKKNWRVFTGIFVEEMICLLDWGCIICAILPMISIYRGILLIYRASYGSYNRDGKERRIGVFKEIGLLLWDFVCVLFMIPLILTVYRLPSIFRNPNAGVDRTPNEIRAKICLQFFYLIVDIPHIFMFLFVFFTFWRSFFMFRDLIKADNGNKRRKSIRHHFLFLFIDILDLPFVLISIIILLTLWRAYAFVCGFVTISKRNNQRRYVFKQFIQWLLDIPTAIAFVFVLLTVYRFPECFRQLKQYYKIWKEEPVDSDKPPPAQPTFVDEDNPVPNQNNAGHAYNEVSWRFIILKHLLLVLIDIPFPVLLLLTLWRLPILIGRLREITDPSRQYTQRRLLILRYLLYVFLDILCAPIILLIIITLWRIPTFINIVKNYKRGDNEHKEIGKLFLRMLLDIPFVFLGALTLIFPWRGIFLIKSIYKESESDKESRQFALVYFSRCLLDILNALVFIFDVCVGPWRIPTIVRIYKHYYALNKEDPWVHTDSLTRAINFSALYILADYLGALQTLFIAIFIRQLLPFIKTIKEVLKEPDFKVDKLQPVLVFYTMETLKDIPHIPLIPFKALGLVFLPLFLFMKRRQSINIFQLPINYFLKCGEGKLNYLGMDRILVISVIGCLIIIPHELGLLIAITNCFYFFLVTLGSPIWDKYRVKIGWTKLGQATGFMSIVEIIILVLQVLTFPLFIALQGFILLLPVLISLGYYELPYRPGFSGWWKSIFTSRDFWHNAHRFNAGVWFFMFFWIIVNVAVWDHLYILSKKYFPLFSPLKAYYWLVKKVFAGRIWGFYKLILAKSTNVCYRLRRACFLGELLMFPLFLIWTCWSFVIPIVTKVYYIFIPAGIISITLMVFAYRIIKNNWRSSPKDGSAAISNEPVLRLQTATVETPEAGGIIFNFLAQKNTTHQQFIEIRLTLDSEPLWDAIKSAIGSSKVSAGLFLVGYPISLTPLFLDIASINQDKKDIEFSVKIGQPGTKFHLKKKVLTKFVNMITKVNDPEFDFVLEYGKKDFGWKKYGVLTRFRSRLSELIRIQENGGILFDNPVEVEYIPPPPPHPGLHNARVNVNNEIKSISPRAIRNSVENFGVWENLPHEDSTSNTSNDSTVDIKSNVNNTNNELPTQPDSQVHIFYDEETGEEIVLDDTIDQKFKSNIV